jgi:hypothetical protein
VLVSGKTIEEVVIEEHTPGVAVAVNESTLAVSFEPGSSLNFSAKSGQLSPEPSQTFAEPPDAFPGNRPPSLDVPAKRAPTGIFTGNYFLAIEPGGRITFQTKSFEAVEESFQAHLMIDSDTLEDVVENRKVLPGMRLENK